MRRGRVIGKSMSAWWCTLLLVGALASGCGSSETDAEVTKEEFIARGDAICAQGQAEAADLARRSQEVQAQIGTLDEAEILDRAEGIWADQISLIEGFHEDLAALGSPPGDEAKIEEFLRSLTDGLAVAREIHAKLAAGEDPPRELVAEYGNIVIRGNTLARAYGMTVCGRTGP